MSVIKRGEWTVLSRVFELAKQKGIDTSNPKFSKRDERLIIKWS